MLVVQLLEDRIRRDGEMVNEDILRVDSFLNHQMDVALFYAMGKEWARLYEGCGVNKILTIEASGIGMACVAAHAFGDVPVVFAKKSKSRNVTGEVYSAEVVSFTHGNVNNVFVSKKYLNPGDRVLIIDDFLASGAALIGLVDLAKQAGAEVVGAGIAIEKVHQGGGEKLQKLGVRVESLAKIKSMGAGSIEFC